MRRALFALVFVALFVFSVESPVFAADGQEQKTEQVAKTETQWVDVKKLTDEQLQAELTQIQQELVELNRRLAELAGPAHEDQRNVVKGRITSLERRLADITKELDQRKHQKEEQGIDQIKAKYRAQISQLQRDRMAARDRAIGKFELLLSEQGESPLAPDILLRLAQLYFEKENDEYLDREEQHEKIVEQLMSEGKDVILPPPPMRDYSKAIELYKKIVDQYPDYDLADGATYLLAYCLSEQGDEDEAKKMYERLIEKYPKSNYIPEAHVRLGEYYFFRNQYDKAIEEYKYVLNYPVSSFFDKALYKLGWSNYLLSRYDEAIDYFTQVSDFYEEGRGQRSFRGEDLKAESMTYMSICFAEKHPFGGGEQEAVAYFTKIGERSWERNILVRIGDVYLERASFAGARDAYAAALNRFPNDPDNPAVWMKVVECYEKEGDYELAITEREKFADKFGPGTEWWQANRGDPSAVQAATEMVANALYASATFHHELAQREKVGSQQKDLYMRAAKDYEKFLQYFPDHTNSYNARFQVAECYYFAGDYGDAGRHYEEVVKDEKGKYFQDAAYGLVVSYDKLIEQKGGLPGPKEQTYIPKQPSEVPEEGQKLIWASEFFIQHFPNDSRNPPIMSRAGEVYLRYGHLEEARKIFDDLMTKYPSSEDAKVAANRIIESYKVEGREDMVAVYGKKILELGTIAKTQEEKAKLESIIQGAVFLEAQKLQEKGDYPNAVNKYLEAARKYPQQEHAPKALHNAAVLAENNLKDLYRANEIYLELIQRYPNSENAKVDMFHTAYNYERLAEFDQAAKTYLDYYRLYPNTEQSQNALFNAALLNETLGQTARSIELYREYVDKYKNQPDVPLVEAKRCRMIGKLQMYDDYTKCLENYIRDFKGRSEMIWAYLELGNLAEKLGRTADAEKRFAQAAAIYSASKKQGLNVSPNETKASAEAMFKLAEFRYKQYEAIKFALPQAKMKKQIEQKAGLWKELSMAYEDIAKTGDIEWGVAALYMLGQINKHFAEALFTAPIPEGMKQEEIDAYKFVLEEQAFPIEDRAVKAFQACVNKAQEKRIWNQYVELAYKALLDYGQKVKEMQQLDIQSLSSGLPLIIEGGGS